ncbi:hypothetical protein NQ315_003113 [Exocentrus adspersus]|uniref:Uncharacterized protein n=1 Tax=Exocentrus adspersus TaxID=1586481 RepID=A0AAV8W587_9CUCU|nr:hypothetical protein NQ315_003113 [Exocentrus adspersus]
MFMVHIVILDYAKLTSVFFMYDAVNLLRKRYENIDKRLGGINNYKVIRSGTIKELQRIYVVYTDVDEAVHTFNKIFGWPMFLSLVETTEMVLFFLAMWVENAVPLVSDKPLPVQGLGVIFTSVVFLRLCGPIMIIFSCDAVLQGANKVLRNCRLLQATVPFLPREMEELKRLENLMENKMPKFTAANFFQINRSTLLAIISTTTTYMIVILQFNFY